MRIKSLLILSTLLLCSACKTSCNRYNATKNSTTLGGSEDSYGCLNAAGYTWSKLKKTCIRPFDQGISLLEINSTKNYQTACFVIIDKDKAEIFIPNEKESVLLTLNSYKNYKLGKYSLRYQNNSWQLYIDATKVYEEINTGG